MKKIIIPLLLLIMSMGLISCKNASVDIYTSVYTIHFITEEIVGDKLIVKSMYPQTAEVHDYEPSAKTLINMSEAKMIIYIGQGLEPFVEDGIDTTFKNVHCVKVTNYDQLELVSATGTHTEINENTTIESVYDPHIWLDSAQMSKITDYILNNILEIEEFKIYEEEFTQSANELKTKFDALASEYQEKISTSKKSVLIVDHDAYAYWTYRYGITRKSLRSDNGSSDPTSKNFIETIDYAVANKLKYLLATKNESQESLINQYLSTVNKKDTTINAQSLYLDNLERLTSDNKDYFDIMEENLSILLKALNNE